MAAHRSGIEGNARATRKLKPRAGSDQKIVSPLLRPVHAVGSIHANPILDGRTITVPPRAISQFMTGGAGERRWALLEAKECSPNHGARLASVKRNLATAFFEFFSGTARTRIVATNFFTSQTCAQTGFANWSGMFSKTVVQLLGTGYHCGNQLLSLLHGDGLFERPKIVIFGILISQGQHGNERSASLFIVDDLCPGIEAKVGGSKKALRPIIPMNFSVFILDKIWQVEVAASEYSVDLIPIAHK